ncbi:aminodeoxychorismate synthase component I [Amycolatopsis sp. A133]|uniref:aminodeoxychorismate synthase component I n=1 Tax=Amycolatopsis sp. A133 TaxID=3064472 RepID=UPI0027FDC4C0|nr:aminodeoxychorismate synthase component I [Amycolatopsis sp. A133]MDQ7803468.1 aminodeoxychorismate synthase component I [Amycolatopsis sp. A133]
MTAAAPAVRALVVDNYDSFTYNLCHYLGQRTETAIDTEVTVIRNDDPSFTLDDLHAFDCVVISPGPGRPERDGDFGVCRYIMRSARIPVLGVCLGHQGLCHAFGGTVLRAPEPYHGRTSPVVHTGEELFRGIPSPFLAVRYHSLVAGRIPAELRVIASTEDGLPMAMRHRSRPLWGVQFHPESIRTEHGLRLLHNFVGMVDRTRAPHRPGTRKPPGTRSRPAASPPAPVGASGPGHRVLVRRLGTDVDAESVFHTLYSGSNHAFWLDSNPPEDHGAGCSFMGDASGPLARIVYADVRRGEVVVSGAAGRSVRKGRLLNWIRADLTSRRVEIPELPFDFALGWVGYLGYELKAETSGDLAHTADQPDAAMIFADRAVAFHHERGEVYLLALARGDDEAPAVAWLDDTERRIAGLRPVPAPSGPAVRQLGPVRLRHDRQTYLRLIKACQEEIRAGESYEVCLTNMMEVPAVLDPWPAYRRLRRDNPVPFATFLRFGDLSVLGCSPERLLRVSADGVAESKPIKGTRPRGGTPSDDEKLRIDLSESVKDLAENLMIVDLIRNDLGSCAEIGSVTVDKLFDIETYSTVHQMVSTVRARLRPGVHAVDCAAAVFPGGSMTGAPKIRTMQIIDRLECGPRGVYSGSVGYFSLSGALDLSITIRTLVASPGRVRFGVGGAITALSDPEEEYEETAVKAAALLSLLGQEFPERTRRD